MEVKAPQPLPHLTPTKSEGVKKFLASQGFWGEMPVQTSNNFICYCHV
jgi:hypothetical protein